MRTCPPSRPLREERASALITAIVFTTVLTLLCGSLLSYAITEKKINQRNRLVSQSRYLAESVVDYGFAQMAARFANQTNLPPDAFRTNPLKTPRAAFFGGYHADETFTEIVAGTVPGATSRVIDPRDPSNASDPLRGQRVFVREVVVYGRAAVIDPRTGDRIPSYAAQRLQVRDAPLFANAIFYNIDMELAPGAPMDVYGSVHSNGNIYANTASSLRFHDTVAAVGQFLHDFAPGSGRGHPAASNAKNVSIDRLNAVGNGTPVSLYQAPTVYDSRLDNFADAADARWDRSLQTGAHGILAQNPVAIDSPAAHDDLSTNWIDESNPGRALIDPARPLTPGSSDAQKEIEQQRFANQAGLRIVVNPRTGAVTAYKRTIDSFGKPATDANGNVIESVVSLPSDGSLVRTYSKARMYDLRRQTPSSGVTNPSEDPGRAIWMADIDVGKLKQVVESPDASDPDRSIAGYDPSSNWNGIVYVEASNTNNTGIRLINGQAIPNLPTPEGLNAGMTFATNSPLYIQGHFNADGSISENAGNTSARFPDNAGEPPAALAADAITILSPAWNDANSGKALSGRIPSNVEISAAFLTGIVTSTGGTYSGGVENFPRFLENWSDRRVAIRGSMVALFESAIATQRWNSTGNIYNAPNRIWGYNELFRGGVYPPGTPNTRTSRRLFFRQLTRDQYEAEVASLGS